jgi:hypothetical protein
MFFFGILGIFQDFLFPGIIILRKIGFKSRFVSHLVAAVSLSLVANYFLVFLLTALHLYTRPFMIILVCGEIIYGFWLYRLELNKPIHHWLNRIKSFFLEITESWTEAADKQKKKTSISFLIQLVYLTVCIMLIFIAINWISKLFIWNLGSVFNSYDTIVSWNKWAVSWAGNSIPSGTWHYPQLLPAIWSILYVLMGDPSIQLFGQAIMPLFTFFILMMMVDLGFAKKNPGYFIGTAIAYLVLKKFLGSYLIEGFADMPAAFFAFTAVYLLIIQTSEKQLLETRKQFGILIAVAAAGCAVTKQVGLVFFALFMIVYFIHYLLPAIKQNWNAVRKYIFITLVVVMVIIVPWYLNKEIVIRQGLDKSEIQAIISHTERVYDSSGIFGRLGEISALFGRYAWLLVLSLVASFFLDPIIRDVFLVVAMPILISWGSYASYDFRNLAIFFPLFALTSGLSLDFVFQKAKDLLAKATLPKISTKWVLLILAFGFLFTAITMVPDQLLKSLQNEQSLNTFSPSLNKRVLDAVKNENGNYSVITSYPLTNLPGFTGKKIGLLFDNYSDYQLTLSRIKVQSVYLLVPKYAEKNIMADIGQKVAGGKYQLLFEDDSWIPYLFIKILIK